MSFAPSLRRALAFLQRGALGDRSAHSETIQHKFAFHKTVRAYDMDVVACMLPIRYPQCTLQHMAMCRVSSRACFEKVP